MCFLHFFLVWLQEKVALFPDRDLTSPYALIMFPVIPVFQRLFGLAVKLVFDLTMNNVLYVVLVVLIKSFNVEYHSVLEY